MLRLAFLSLLAVSLPAQIITATLTGAVHDPQRAAVPAAALTVTSVETAQTRAATSDSEGRYSVPFLAPGTYSLPVTAKGFIGPRGGGSASPALQRVIRTEAL
jgi:hypothetical protein